MKKSFLILFISLYTLQVFAQISSATFGTMNARHLGPAVTGGRISAIEGVNNEPRTIYIGTAGGGVWKTSNAGATFSPLFDKYCQSIGAIAIDQKSPKTIYVGTGESNMRNTVSVGEGLYKTTDGGENWKRIGGLDETEHISKIIIDPSNSNTIYVAVPGPLWSDSEHRGLYKSTDGGNTFQKIIYINNKTGVADIAIDPTNTNIIYATTWEFRRTPYSFSSGGQGSGIHKSIDGGKTWKELTKGIPAKPIGRTALTLAPSEPNHLIAIIEDEKTGLYISDDAGETWKEQSVTFNVVSRPFYFSTLVVDPKDSKRVYRPAYSFSYSDDGGYSFADGSGGSGGIFGLHPDMHALWINPNYTNQLYLGTDGGVYISNDRGASWMMLATLPVSQFYHVAYDMQEPYNVYGGLQDNGSWYAPSKTAFGTKNADWKFIYGGDGFWVQPDPINPEYAYAEYQGGEIGRVNIKEGVSVSIKPQQATGEEKLRFNWNTPIQIGAKNKSNLYIGAQYLYKSTDKGKSWARISPDLTTNDKNKQQQENSGGLTADNTSAENHCTIFSIAESPIDDQMIWVGTDDGNLQYSGDGGKSWVNVSAHYPAAGIPKQTWVSSIEPSKYDINTVYVTLENHMYGDRNTYLIKSTDKGKTWMRIMSDEFSGYAHKIKEDLVNKNLLFLGTEHGLFASLDGGAKWIRMKNNIPWRVMVRDIQIHPVTHDLIIATHGRGILIVDNITAMRNMTTDIAAKEVHIFTPDPVKLTMGNLQLGGTGGEGWTAGNPPQQAPIKYYFKNRLNVGDVRVMIYDQSGKLIQSIPGSKRKGLNVVYWNMRATPPQVASGGSKFDQSGLVAPLVLPGAYTVKIKVGDQTYDSKLDLVADNDPTFTMEDRKQQYETAYQLFAMHENLAKLTADVDKKNKMLQAPISKLKDPKNKTVVKEYSDKLEELRGSLVPLKQTSVFADEKRLREDISDVYLAVTGQEARPNNLQIERVKFLQTELRKSSDKLVSLNQQYNDRVMAIFKKEKIDLEKP